MDRPAASPRISSSIHPCGLLFKATRGITVAFVSPLDRKWRQPGLATNGPAFVGRRQLVGSVQGSEVHFDFVRRASENGRSAARAEKSPGIVACFSIDRHRILRKYRGSVKKRPVMLAAVETVAKADPVWSSRRHNSNVAAQAAAGESVHAAPPLKSSGRNVCDFGRPGCAGPFVRVCRIHGRSILTSLCRCRKISGQGSIDGSLAPKPRAWG